MMPTQWERTVRKGSGREESPFVQCGADWKINLSVGKGKEKGQDEMMQKNEIFTEGLPWAQTLFRNLGRKTRRARASCSTYFLVHTFWWITVKPTNKVSLSLTHRDPGRYTGQWSDMSGRCPLAQVADVFKPIVQVPVCQ